MTSEPDQATRLLPDRSGWAAGPASLSELTGGTALHRVYGRGRAQAVVRVTAGPPAEVTVATTMNFPIGGMADGASRVWMVGDCKAHLVQSAGFVRSLSIILRGGPGDLPGSVVLEITGRRLPSAAAIDLALGLDWDAIRAGLADRFPLDRLRIAAAQDPALVLDPRDGPARLWPMLPSVASMQQVDKLRRRRPPRLALVNAEAIHAAGNVVDERTPALGYQDRNEHDFAAIPSLTSSLRTGSSRPTISGSGSISHPHDCATRSTWGRPQSSTATWTQVAARPRCVPPITRCSVSSSGQTPLTCAGCMGTSRTETFTAIRRLPG